MDKLTSIELRILGSLVEKQITTPDYYPMTLNALINACNQKNNRHPVVHYDEMIVETGLDSLRRQGLIKKLQESGGRASKYAHEFPVTLRLERDEVAILVELILRGPQTPGELRQRASRLFNFRDLAAIEAVLEMLLHREAGPLVAKLPRQSGSREARYAHLLGDDPLPTEEEVDEDQDDETGNSGPTRRDSLSGTLQRIVTLEQEVASLRAELAELRRRIGPVAPPPPPAARPTGLAPIAATEKR